MKKTYFAPEITIEKVESENIICASIDIEGEYGGDVILQAPDKDYFFTE